MGVNQGSPCTQQKGTRFLESRSLIQSAVFNKLCLSKDIYPPDIVRLICSNTSICLRIIKSEELFKQQTKTLNEMYFQTCQCVFVSGDSSFNAAFTCKFLVDLKTQKNYYMIHKLCMYIACGAASPSLNLIVDTTTTQRKVLVNTWELW